jgi:YggT family protein
VFPLNFHGNNPLYTIGQIYVLVLFARAVLSWFPYSHDSPLNPVRRVIFTLTEPVLAPFRRIIPPVGMLDLSFLVAIIVVEILVGLLGRVHF